MHELETVDALERHLAAGRPLRDVILQGLDLRGREALLRGHDVAGAVFLGCELAPEALQALVRDGAMVFPPFRGLPYSPYRGALYTPDELYAGFDPAVPASYARTLDARVYAHWVACGRGNPPSLLGTLAQRLHDHAVTDALEDLLAGRDPVLGAAPQDVVAVMGGHAMLRGAPDYAQVAHLGRALAGHGFFLVTGGGPGAMEATHLGAWFARRPPAELDAALAHLALAPSYTHPDWLARAFEVRARWPLADVRAGASLGIPTWHYGHEPPNPFATHVAKYFANSVREDGLLAIATGGVVYAPGSAGTIQEVFQDACQNHYNTVGVVSPMVFLGEDFWTRQRPVYPLLAQLAQGHAYARYLSVTDDAAHVVEALRAFAAQRRMLRAAPQAPPE